MQTYTDEAYDSFDCEIGAEAVGDGFKVLPPGTYAFTVRGVEKQRYGGGEKMPACWVIVVALEADADDIGLGRVALIENLYMTRRQSWKVRDLFVSTGLLDKGQETFTPQWNRLVGATGVMQTANHEYNGNTYNDVKRFLDPARGAEQLARAMWERGEAAAAAPAAQPQPTQPGFSFPGV